MSGENTIQMHTQGYDSYLYVIYKFYNLCHKICRPYRSSSLHKFIETFEMFLKYSGFIRELFSTQESQVIQELIKSQSRNSLLKVFLDLFYFGICKRTIRKCFIELHWNAWRLKSWRFLVQKKNIGIWAFSSWDFSTWALVYTSSLEFSSWNFEVEARKRFEIDCAENLHISKFWRKSL